MICKNCGQELTDGARFCSNCGSAIEESYEAENSINDSGNFNNDNIIHIVNENKIGENAIVKAKNNKKIIIFSSVAVGILVLGFALWCFSGGILINMAYGSLEEGNPDSARSYLSMVCPFGYKSDDAKEVEENIDKSIDVLKEATEAMAVQDYISALNKAKESVDILPQYEISNLFYADYTERFCNWLTELYNQGDFSEAAHALAQLSDGVNSDSDNTLLADTKAMFLDKSS